MAQEKIKSGDFVLPGQVLGVIEEYIPEKGSTYERDGTIYASRLGLVDINPRTHNIRIKGESEPNQLRRGDQVIGFIRRIRKYSVGLDIYKRNDQILYSPIVANIHVSRVSRQYVQKLEDAFQETDIVRARVIGKRGGEFELSTEANYLGVINAECAVCGHTLRRKDRLLTCEHCGNREKRLLANDYGRVQEKVVM